MKAVAEFQQEVLTTIGEVAPDVKARIIQNLKKGRAVRSAFGFEFIPMGGIEMGRKKPEEKSIVTHKKEDLYDQLLTPLEVEEFLITPMSPEQREEIANTYWERIYGMPDKTKPEGGGILGGGDGSAVACENSERSE